MGKATKQIETLMYERHEVRTTDEPDFSVQDTTEIAATLGIITGTLTLMLSGDRGISLLVGVFEHEHHARAVTERDSRSRISDGDRSERQRYFASVLIEFRGCCRCIGWCDRLLGTERPCSNGSSFNAYKPGTDWRWFVSIPAAFCDGIRGASVGVFYRLLPARRAASSTRLMREYE